ncbi:hypothetical protein LCGC14_1368430, partial [marine sediment metagenome]
YVDGALLDRFLGGLTGLKRVVTYNKILVICNEITGDTVNAVSAARCTIGVDAEIFKLPTPLNMTACVRHGKAIGMYGGVDALIESIKGMKFDALAIHTPIEVDRETALTYYKEGGVNPWGGIEAIVCRKISTAIDKPVAHAPVENVTADDAELFNIFQSVVPSRIAAEAISCCYLHCVLKGLHRAPRPISVQTATLTARDVDFMVTPTLCWGKPHELCRQQGIFIIAVAENQITYSTISYTDIIVKNYWEAAGYIQAMRAGIHPDSVRSSLSETRIL